MKCEELIVTNFEGFQFKFDLRHKEEKQISEYSNIVLICPGFLAFKDWGPFPYIGESLCDEDFATIVMNYSHNGIGEKKNKITEYKKFSENTITKEIGDILTVLKWIDNNIKKFKQDLKIILIGHSRGAANCIIAGRNILVNGIITISPIASYDRWNEKIKSQWRQRGFLPISNEKSDPLLKIGLEYLNDLERNKDSLNIESAARKIKIPWLIIHGENDLVAKPDEARKLFDISNKNLTEFISIPQMGHLLGYNQTLKNENNFFLKQIISIIKIWLNKNFRSLNE